MPSATAFERARVRAPMLTPSDQMPGCICFWMPTVPHSILIAAANHYSNAVGPTKKVPPPCAKTWQQAYWRWQTGRLNTRSWIPLVVVAPKPEEHTSALHPRGRLERRHLHAK